MTCRLPIPLTAHILVVRSLPGLGDLLCAVPALRSLRSAYPFAKITWLGLPGTEWFSQRFNYLIDHWLPFPGFPGIPEGWQSPQKTVEFLGQIQGQHYDLVLQLHGNGSSINSFLVLLGARQQAGFYLPGQFCPEPRYFLPYPQRGSEADRLLRLMEFLGLPEQRPELEFPLSEDEHEAGLQLLKSHNLSLGQYICLHPGANSADRRWSIDGFTRVAQSLANQGYRIVLTGTDSERGLTAQICAAVGAASLDFAGCTALGELAVVLQQAALLICNDTGISHLGAALKVSSVVVFSNSEVERWAPSNSASGKGLEQGRHRTVDSRQTGAATAWAVLAQARSLLNAQSQLLPEVCYAR
ncbi:MULTISPECIES: glycosyltransferase family 9 protein [Cyanophyceae]|uniref:Glycosyltransferase family 9 protein n=1 Tax=Leptolyngbya subtilissima DQ-A4 TaxID=2933933 RepID=A0ABV0K956_9CYAN|nr:glycosyltransferase family 9 protein [Nodosilinea sp. FACHB-141]MBD2114226.1 glycosyltransferase family 9 protein [Nodosilinea sp. FACHB-141]